jgi:hypothetical protein
VSPPGPNHTVVLDSESIREKNKAVMDMMEKGGE